MKKILLLLLCLAALFAFMSCGKPESCALIFHTETEEHIDTAYVLPEELADYSLPVPQKQGYVFEGWYRDAALTQPFDPAAVTEPITVELYAKYRMSDEMCELIFFVDSEHTVDSITAYLADLSVLGLPTPEKEGYVFVGWCTDEMLQEPFEVERVTGGGEVRLYARFESIDHVFQVNVLSNMEGAAEYSGGALQQTVIDGCVAFEEITISPALGYRYLYYELNGTRYTDNVIRLPEGQTTNAEILVCFDYATYELPIINIDTNGAGINSKVDYTDMTFDLLNTEKEFVGESGGIRLRGNSTMGYAKKPYRIKLDSKLDLFGLTKAKSWVLLAEYIDPSGLHNFTAFSMGKESDNLSFTPTPHKVNVYLNGEYIGLYTLCEQVQENKGRIDIETDITENMTDLKDFNFFICMDANAELDPEAVENETYFWIDKYDLCFELKYPEKGDFANEAQFRSFFEQLVAYTEGLLDAFAAGDTATIEAETDLKSLVDYLIIDQIMGEQDHVWKSFNMYYTNTSDNAEENGRLHFGPIWDYDWALYTPWTDLPNDSYEISDKIAYSNIFFKAVVANGDYFAMVKERYHQLFAPFLESYTEELVYMTLDMIESLELNQLKWYADKPGLTVRNIKFLREYLLFRKELLDTAWAVE
ncbi:MAG: CotH kinase family protein [Clostridia bacterium]|nr:CotH kinase family protein [Clostridia bacterium]